MARAARLKVYRTSAGFEDAYVAAPSQAAALKAWGVTTDLFARKEAEVVTDEALTAEALASPGSVVRRPRGDLAAMLAATPKQEPRPNAEKTAAERETHASAAAPPPPDRSALNAAERALSEARERLARELDAISEERAHLEELEARTRREGGEEVKRLDRARAEAKRAFRKAGG